MAIIPSAAVIFGLRFLLPVPNDSSFRVDLQPFSAWLGCYAVCAATGVQEASYRMAGTLVESAGRSLASSSVLPQIRCWSALVGFFGADLQAPPESS